jgi:hypothetical protein
MAKPFDNAVSAQPSSTVPGGTIYTFANGTSVLVSGGSSGAYRANSPGINVSSVGQNPDLSDPNVESTISSAMNKYGAIGYSLSTGGTVELVFANATAAQSALQTALNSQGAASNGGTLLQVLEGFNGGGNPNYDSYITKVFGSSSSLLSTQFSQLTPDQVNIALQKTMQSEGFNSPNGNVTVQPTPTPTGSIWIKGENDTGPDDSGPNDGAGTVAVTTDESNGSVVAENSVVNSDGSIQYDEEETTTAAGVVSATVSGTGAFLSISDAASIMLGSGSSGTVNGSDNTIATTGSAVDFTVVGNNETLNDQYGANAFALSGTGESGAVTGDTVNFGANSTGTFSGGGNTVTGASGDAITVAGTNGQADTVSASNATVNVNGSAQVNFAAGSNNDTIALGADSSTGNTANVNGSNNNVTMDVGGETVALTGGNNTVTFLTGYLDTITVAGTNGQADSIDAHGDYVNVDGGAQAIVSGDENRITLDTGSSTTLSGLGGHPKPANEGHLKTGQRKTYPGH